MHQKQQMVLLKKRLSIYLYYFIEMFRFIFNLIIRMTIELVCVLWINNAECNTITCFSIQLSLIQRILNGVLTPVDLIALQISTNECNAINRQKDVITKNNTEVHYSSTACSDGSLCL